MKPIRRYFIWFYMLAKRLFLKWSFVAILCLIPIIVPLFGAVMQSEESGVLRITLCNEGEDPKVEEIINELIAEDSVILFSVSNTRKEAESKVKNQKADAAWVFSEDFEKTVYRNITRGDDPPVEIIKREYTLPLRIANEKLFGAIYGEVSYSIYKSYVYRELADKDTLSEDEVRERYDSLMRGRDIVVTEKLDSEKAPEVKLTYLTAPIRGILAIILVLCALVAAVYFLEDNKNGRFDWLSERQKIAPAFASSLSASLICACAVLAAIYFAGVSVGITGELLPMLMLVLEATCFALFLSMLYKSPTALGASIPAVIITMLALSPIFFNLDVLLPIRLMLPTYYYLNSIYNSAYILYGAIYCVCAVTLSFVLNLINAKKTRY